MDQCADVPDKQVLQWDCWGSAVDAAAWCAW